MASNFLLKNKHTLWYGLSLAVLLFLLRWLQLRFIIISHALEIYISAIAIIFTALGVWLALKLAKPGTKTVIVEKEIVVEKEVPINNSTAGFTLNENELHKLGISKRELEVLELMAKGLSNQEIAAQLFVSLNTVKTHAASLLRKMEVDRRTQAIDKARKLNIIP